MDGTPRARPRERPRGDINVTPLVDVCLVLLIIFMVVTPMLDPHADVALPKTAAPEKLPREPERLTVAVKEDGTTWLENRWLPSAELSARLAEIHARSAGKEIVVVADRELSFRDVRRVLGIVRAAGFPGVGLAASRATE
jgi:biopolymer transport protein ExbD